jgi:Mor family transcriptional regulator
MVEQNAIARPLDERELSLHDQLTEIVRGPLINEIIKGPLMDGIVAAIMAEFRSRMGGRRVYVPVHPPRMPEKNIQARDDAVRRAFNGRNMREVCKQFSIGRSTFYKITGARKK